ncbi:phytanoyl-CoA dioxygenase family protein [Methylobacterium sp. A49B]
MYDIDIDGDLVRLDLSGEPPKFGADEILAEREGDILGDNAWYGRGYEIVKLFEAGEFAALKASVTHRIQGRLRELGIPVPDDFKLEQYHKIIGTSDKIHQKVIEFTRELRFEDFEFDLKQVADRLSRIIGHKLTAINNELGHSFVIARINRPGSNDYNPPHKDGYLSLWQRTVNVWIPIAGVTSRSSLPVVPGSHLLPESTVCRTGSGALLNGRPYRVPAVVSWSGSNAMTRPLLGEGDLLVFSPLLIHGCAKNFEVDSTRVALELRLSSDA